MIVYIAVSDVNYEGSNLEGVYTKKEEAAKHHFSHGDWHRIEKWSISSKGVGRMVSGDVYADILANIKRKRKVKK